MHIIEKQQEKQEFECIVITGGKTLNDAVDKTTDLKQDAMTETQPAKVFNYKRHVSMRTKKSVHQARRVDHALEFYNRRRITGGQPCDTIVNIRKCKTINRHPRRARIEPSMSRCQASVQFLTYDDWAKKRVNADVIYSTVRIFTVNIFNSNEFRKLQTRVYPLRISQYRSLGSKIYFAIFLCFY